MISVKLSPWIFILLSGTACAQVDAKCRTESVKTDQGSIDHIICRDAKKHYTHAIKHGEQLLLQSEFLAEEERNKGRSIWIYSGKALPETGCPDRLYLIDIGKKPEKVISFGIKKACNLFHWASWGDKRSVIALKKNVSFVYENGKITPPPSGEKLWNAIEAPHAGSGLTQEDAVGFVEELQLPR